MQCICTEEGSEVLCKIRTCSCEMTACTLAKSQFCGCSPIIVLCGCIVFALVQGNLDKEEYEIETKISPFLAAICPQ